MEWQKLGRTWVPDGSLDWAKQYAFPPVPVPGLRADGSLRVYVSCCDAGMVGSVGWVDVDPADPTTVVDVARTPVLERGGPGRFDENGVVPLCIVPIDGRLHMYYVGFQLGMQVRYYQFLGLATSDDDGASWQRVQQTPVIDRSPTELVNRTSGFVHEVDGVLRLYYVGGSEWVEVDGKSMPTYDVRLLESTDPAVWGPAGEVVLPREADEYALGRPWVTPHPDGGWQMFFSSRTRSRGYRIGYATSPDGRTWARDMAAVGIDVSPGDDWDSEMVAYAATYAHAGETYMLYNGNDCGRTGFGAARLVG